jgi:hypothetical protein
MTQWQDSSHPTGVAADSDHDPLDTRAVVSRARARKADAAVQLRLAGASWQEIALTLGYPTPRAALVATEKSLQRLLTTGDRDHMRQLAGARLERLLRGVWGKAINPEDPEHLFAVAKARDIIDRHARLFGLDAPTEIVVHSPTQTELDAWVTQVVSHTVPEVAEFDIIAGEVTSSTALEA